MVSFPQIKRIEITGYELYPGKDGIYLTQIPFDDGPWMILGVNGLGKSTLLMMLRFLLTGPNIPSLPGFKGEKSKPYTRAGESTFSVRVSDGARDAYAILSFVINNTHFTVRRHLKNLSLDRAEIENSESKIVIDSEQDLQQYICKSIGISDESDFFKIVSWVLFYLDDKTPLIWDVDAQYEIFRSILIPKISKRFRELEGIIITSDSTIRNISDAIRKMEDREKKEIEKIKNASDVRKEIEKVIAEKNALSDSLSSALLKLDSDEETERDAATMFKRAEFKLEDSQNKYEYHKITELQNELEKYDNSTKYLIIKSLTDSSCVFCGTESEEIPKLIKSRVLSGRCISCDENVARDSSKDKAKESTDSLASYLEECRSSFNNYSALYKESKENLKNTRENIESIRAAIDKLDTRLKKLTSSLPAGERLGLSAQESRLSLLRDQLRPFREDKENAEQEIVTLVAQLKIEAEKVKDKIIDIFQERAKIFFAEGIKLIYAPRTTKIGQGAGRKIELPAFEIEMTSGATKDQFMRRRASEVSLSQRDYIDLIFRMALIESLSDSGGSLIIDGPEGAVDAIFAKRAGVLIRDFSNSTNINTISACNIVDGDFIPSVLSGFSKVEERKAHVVNLIDIAVPTAAVRSLMSEYKDKIQKIISSDL